MFYIKTGKAKSKNLIAGGFSLDSSNEESEFRYSGNPFKSNLIGT